MKHLTLILATTILLTLFVGSAGAGDANIIGSWVEGVSHAEESGSDRLLLFYAHAEEDPNVVLNLSAVTYGGQSMTKIIDRNNFNSNATAYCAVYYLDDDGIDSATDGNFVVTWTETDPDFKDYSSVFLEGVDQNTPVGQTDSNSSESSDASTGALSTSEGDMVFLGATNGNSSGAYTLNNNFTEGIQITCYSIEGVGGYKDGNGESHTPSVTHDNVNRQVIVGFVVKATAELTYTLTVNSGTGDGDYEEGTKVNIVADSPGTGQAFDVWTGDTGNIEDVYDSDTNITMPGSNAEVTATYYDILYRLDVNSGTGDGNYTYNTKVNIVADSPGEGQQFDVWTGDTANIENVNLADTNITMPAADAEVTATYESVLPDPWEANDIGTPPAAGSAAYADGNWTVEGSGQIWSNGDEFHFVYQPYSGNLEIIANVLEVAGDNEWATGGVMIRETLDGNSMSAYMAVSGDEVAGLVYDYRTETDGSTTETMVSGEGPEWVKLHRVGDTIKGYHSNDGSSWTLVDTITFTGLDSNVYVGFGVTNNDDPNSCTSKYQSLSVSPLYTLTVNSGSGDGSYAENDKVNIVADSPGTGQAFDVWTGDTANIENVNLADTNITMPASSAEVTATYYDIIYRLDVNSGTGDGNYTYNTKVNIVADSPGTGQAFDVWTGDTAGIENVNLADTNITMPAANAEVTATYADIIYRLDVNSGTGDGNYTYNTKVNIVADDPSEGQQFDCWTGDTANIENVNLADTNITMPAANAEVTATYESIPGGAGDVNVIGSWTQGLSHAEESGSDRLLLFYAHAENDPNVPLDLSAVTYGGQSMTKVIDKYYWTNATAYCAVYRLDDDGIDSATDANFVVTWTGTNPDYKYYSSVFLEGVDQNSPVGQTDSNTSESPDASTGALSTGEGDVVFVGATNGDSGSYTLNNGFTEEIEYGNFTMDCVGGYKDGNGESHTPSVTHDSVNRQVIVGFVVKAESAAADPNALPSPWDSADIGSPPEAGSAVEVDGNWTVEGSGTIFGQADAFHFAYRTWNGDVQISAHVLDCDETFNGWAIAGVMIRETLDGNSKSALMAVSGTSAGGFVYDYRIETGGNTSETSVSGEEPEWVRLVRDGNVITGYHSSNGTDWTQVDAITFDMDANVYVGLAVAENDDANICIGKYRDVSVSEDIQYLLTVNSGSGDGTYEEGTKVNIVADAPGAGQQFDVWTGDTANIEDVNLADTNITMPAANAEVTATYADDPNTYTLTVNSGTGDGTHESGTKVNIVADSAGSGQQFDCWTGDTTNVEDVNLADTNITMPASDTEVTATYEDDPNTFQLTVNSGTGDGYYDPNDKVNIVANSPGGGQIFDCWTGDTANIENVNLADTNITMPAANTEVTATYEDDPNYVPSERGYHSRACGFDMDDDGNFGGTGDDDVGDGVTTDPDGDGVDEDLIYVDATDGNDSTGDGSPNNPYKTVQKGLDMCDGPGDGAEDIVAIAGTFKEMVSFTQVGVAGHYTRDSFQFPNNPTMLIGWDKDNDGEYPPYDTDDEAVLDGNLPGDGNYLRLAIDQRDSIALTHVEIAHLTIQWYGYQEPKIGGGPSGAMYLFRAHAGDNSHVYVHDVELYDINKAIENWNDRIVFVFWGGIRSHVAMINCLVDRYGSWFCRGSPKSPSAYFRFQNLTLKMYGLDTDSVIGWKMWNTHNYVEIIDNIIDGNPRAWGGFDRQWGVAIGVCAQDWTIRNNEFIDCKQPIQMFGYSIGQCESRPVDNIVIDRNIIRQTYDGWTGWLPCIKILGGKTPSTTVADVEITNNFFYNCNANDPEDSNVGWYCGINSEAGNDEGNQPGTVTIVGNTIYGLEKQNPVGGPTYGIRIFSRADYPQQNYVVKNNIVTKMHSTGANRNIYTNFAPSNFVANGNVYDANGDWHWDGSGYDTLAEWQSASGQDANSTIGYPLFVDDANGDLHLDPNDTAAQGAGVDISSITTVDIDGDTRDANTRTAGADVP